MSAHHSEATQTNPKQPWRLPRLGQGTENMDNLKLFPPKVSTQESAAAAAAAKSLQSCPTLCDPVDCQGSCPCDFPGKNTGVGCHTLLQGIFPTQGSNQSSPASPASKIDSLPLSHRESPVRNLLRLKKKKKTFHWNPTWLNFSAKISCGNKM